MAKPYSSKWQRVRDVFLKENPLCAYCRSLGIVTASKVVDHITPHKGDMALFWDVSNFQPLCFKCHDSAKKKEEGKGGALIGEDGCPEGWGG